MIYLDKSKKSQKVSNSQTVKKKTQQALTEQLPNSDADKMNTDVAMHTSESNDQTEESSKDVKPAQQKDEQNKESCEKIADLDNMPKNTSENEQQIDTNDVFDPVEHREFEEMVKDWNFTEC